ncbi:MAG TPA: response regulator [Pirellulales bacterium]|jgi:response regulator NasT|nr:response regulator [Pirellulales bacterium]
MNSQSLRICVADDEPDMRDFFEKILPVLGHQVVAIAETGKELVEHCHELNPDMVITDIKMPDMDGIDAAQAICQERPVPVILISAHFDSALIQRAEAEHVLAYLVKPVGRADLEPAIALAAHRFAEMQALRQETDSLRQTLADRRFIEQAKGILMRAAGLSEKDAYRRLQELASERNKKLVDAAHLVLSLERALRPADKT